MPNFVLGTSPNPDKPSGGLRVLLCPSPTQTPPELTPGTPDSLTPVSLRAAPPWDLAPAAERRRPAPPFTLDRPICKQRPRLDREPVRSESLDLHPTGLIQRYRFGLRFLLKRPSSSSYSTRSPLMFKNIYAEVLFLAFDPLSFFNFEPAVQPGSFCELDPEALV